MWLVNPEVSHPGDGMQRADLLRTFRQRIRAQVSDCVSSIECGLVVGG